jgi:predicted regulator of Ras-like GTPase activity (Roadblock/LC7/MglB family)
MTIPFLDFFNKLRSRFLAPAVESITPRRRANHLKKPDDQRFRKTVLPNTTRSLAPPDPFRVASGVASSGAAPGQLGPANVLGPSGPTVSRARDLPRALALALEPKVERTISVPLQDFIDQVPPEYIKPVEVIDASRVVALKASEIEKGMPEHNPSVTLASLYQQVPEIFLRSVVPSDATRVSLPYQKVLDQINSTRVREDQERDQRVPQLDTPILQATIKDTERFGTKIEPLESSALPPVPVEPASAEAFASAEPEPVATEKKERGEPDSSRSYRVISLKSEPDPDIEPMVSREAPPVDLPPNGTGAPASERVPASSGPPVPNLSLPKQPAAPPPPLPGEPKRIPFNFPSEDLKDRAKTPPAVKPPDAPSPGPDSAEPQENSGDWITSMADLAPKAENESAEEREAGTVVEKKETESDGEKIALALKAVLQSVPAFQLNGDVVAVPEEARIEFPLALVQSQLASGRVSIAAERFRETLPETYRHLFVIDPADTPVSLPLQEVLKNLPGDVLKIRADQVNEAPADDIETPFSKRAAEDATRFETSPPAPVQKAVKPPVPEPAAVAQPRLPVAGHPKVPPAEEIQAPAPTAEKVETPVLPAVEPPVAKKSDKAKTDGGAASVEEVDGKKVVAQACQIPGVSACEITFPDGLSLAGNFPPQTGAEGLCAMAPMVLQRIDQHMAESRLGSLTAMTLHSANSSVTFLMKENICLAALHKEEGALAPEARAELERLVEKLSHTYAQPERTHVDH